MSVIISGDWHKYNYGVKDIGEPKCDALSSDELGLQAIANFFRAVMSAGWEDRNASLVASAHVMAFLLGALEAEGEWVIVDDPTKCSRSGLPE